MMRRNEAQARGPGRFRRSSTASVGNRHAGYPGFSGAKRPGRQETVQFGRVRNGAVNILNGPFRTALLHLLRDRADLVHRWQS